MDTTTLPPGVVPRPGTQDAWLYECVYRDNEYGLPDAFDAGDVVVDVGANVGAFAWACLDRGCAMVHCFEACLDNARRLAENLGALNYRAEVNHLAVWRSDRPDGWLRVSEARPIRGGILETGGHTVVQNNGFATVGCTGLDRILERVGPVRLLKLDCEAAEFPILFTARRLDLVREIVGEYHEDWQDPCLDAQVDGFRPSADCLKAHLERQGFRVTVVPGPSRCLGLFRAVRL